MNLFIITLILVKVVNCKWEAFIVGGDETRINQYPHSIFLNIYCKGSAYICGGSILNQMIMLTAAHCLEECTYRRYKRELHLLYGHENLDKMRTMPLIDFMIHEKYDGVAMENDICLVKTKHPLKLGRVAQRVSLLRTTPRHIKLAYIAGWGVMNAQKQSSKILLHAKQQMQPVKLCWNALGPIPRGAFCAGPLEGPGAPDQGDSGGALMIQTYIQIGIVSYKVQAYSLVVYTNVSYHYDWVRRSTPRLACRYRRL